VVNVLTNPEPPSQVVKVLDESQATERRNANTGRDRTITAVATAGGGSEIARLTARANALLAQRDIASARIVLERAVDLGSAKAAFALAETYDPIRSRCLAHLRDARRCGESQTTLRQGTGGGVQEVPRPF
jgi:hypothetical protein